MVRSRFTIDARVGILACAISVLAIPNSAARALKSWNVLGGWLGDRLRRRPQTLRASPPPLEELTLDYYNEITSLDWSLLCSPTLDLLVSESLPEDEEQRNHGLGERVLLADESRIRAFFVLVVRFDRA